MRHGKVHVFAAAAGMVGSSATTTTTTRCDGSIFVVIAVIILIFVFIIVVVAIIFGDGSSGIVKLTGQGDREGILDGMNDTQTVMSCARLVGRIEGFLLAATADSIIIGGCRNSCGGKTGVVWFDVIELAWNNHRRRV